MAADTALVKTLDATGDVRGRQDQDASRVFTNEVSVVTCGFCVIRVRLTGPDQL